MVRLRNICINTLHKGDNDDDDDDKYRTDRTIPNNKPDIKIHDNKQGTYMLIDVAISGDRNVIKKEGEKILKYKDPITEYQRMWNVKAKVIPVITGTNGTISKSLRRYLNNITGRQEITEHQKTTILDTAAYCGKC